MMRANEFITEVKDTKADFGKADGTISTAIRSAVSIPGISMNKSNGSSYAGYRFGLAMAGAPVYPTAAAGAIAGDPLLCAYTDEELEIINFAANQVGAGAVKQLSNNRSEELSNTQTVSPVAKPKRNKYGV